MPVATDKPQLPRKVLLVHKGAMGDFLQIWPSLCSLTRFAPDIQFVWAGREQYSIWTKPLGITQCPGSLKQLADSLYCAADWPEGLGDYQLVWFGLKKNPLEHGFSRVWFVPGLREGECRPPREVYAECLAERGVPGCAGWLELWRQIIGRNIPGVQVPGEVLLFPGAGHAKRCWPAEKFERLGVWLSERGWRVRCVYGPAEIERGIRVKKFKPVYPEDFQTLQDLLCRTSMVIGNDSGPLHLAGYLGTPALALFGPASPEQWGPYGVTTVNSDLPCSPCTDDGTIACDCPTCMQEISLQQVQRAIIKLQESADL